MLGVFHIFQTIGYYGFGTLVPLVLASKGYSVVTSLTFTTLTFIGYPVGSALSLPIIERVDRRWLIVGSALLMSVLGIGMGYSTSSTAIVAARLLVYGGEQRLLEWPAHLSGGDLSDVRQGNRSRCVLWPEPALERGDAVRPVARARAMGRRSHVRRRGRGAVDRHDRRRTSSLRARPAGRSKKSTRNNAELPTSLISALSHEVHEELEEHEIDEPRRREDAEGPRWRGFAFYVIRVAAFPVIFVA